MTPAVSVPVITVAGGASTLIVISHPDVLHSLSEEPTLCWTTRRAGCAAAAAAGGSRLPEDVSRRAWWDRQDAGGAAVCVHDKGDAAGVVSLLGASGEHGELRGGVRRDRAQVGNVNNGGRR